MPKSKEDVERELKKHATSIEKDSRAIDERTKKETRGNFCKSEEKP